MRQQLPTLITRISKSKSVHLVFACAWCPKAKHKKLHENEMYTHGICEYHKAAFLSQIHSKISKVKSGAKIAARPQHAADNPLDQ